MQSEILNLVILSNSINDYLFALAIFAGLLLFFALLQFLIVYRLKRLVLKTQNDIDDNLLEVISSVKPPLYTVLAFFFAVKSLNKTDFLDQIVNFLILLLIVYQLVHSLHIFVNFLIIKALAGDKDEGAKKAISVLSSITKGILWSVGGLVILQNIGINVTSLVAGFGIGGIAIALASQEILSDLFSSFSIVFDKPFVPGDFIKIGNYSGEVQKIGIKTTRIKTSQGEELVVSNKELTSSKIQNFGKMEKRRIVFEFGVEYSTKHQKLQLIPKIVKKIITKQKNTEFDRSFFTSFGDSDLKFENVYYVKSSDYKESLDTQEKINLEIKQEFEKQKIEFAYPTQTIILQK